MQVYGRVIVRVLSSIHCRWHSQYTVDGTVAIYPHRWQSHDGTLKLLGPLALPISKVPSPLTQCAKRGILAVRGICVVAYCMNQSVGILVIDWF